MTMNRSFVGITIRTWWTLVIACSVSSLGTWAAIDHANAQKDRATAQANVRIEQKFRQALLISDIKHKQALHAQAVLFAYSTNKSVCGFRLLVEPQLRRAIERRAQYPTLTKAARELNENAIKTTNTFLSSQVTIPSDFNCKSLPQKPPNPVVPNP